MVERLHSNRISVDPDAIPQYPILRSDDSREKRKESTRKKGQLWARNEEHPHRAVLYAV